MPSAAPALVVATTSPYRLALLDRLGVTYRAVPHRVDERAFQASLGARTPESLARALANAKADSVAAEHPGALILGSDQVVDLDGELLGKPGSAEKAVEQLVAMSGRAHRLITAVTLRLPDGTHDEHIDVHIMRMRTLSPAQLGAYVARDQPLDCAGSYRIESLGIALFDAVNGPDFTGIVGLPLTAVAVMLARAGIDVLAPRPGGAGP